jgi:hypothetical protein
MDALLHTFKLAANACGTKTGFLPSLYDGIACPGNDVQIRGLDDIWLIVANVVRILIASAGALAVIFIIVGGLYYVTSAGDPARLKQAKEIIVQAITGLIVIIAAYAVITFIGSKF